MVKSISPSANIVLIQAAIYQATGIRIKQHDLFMMLLEEKMITKAMITRLSVPDLNTYGSSFTPTEKLYDTSLIPVDVVVKEWPSLITDKRTELESE